MKYFKLSEFDCKCGCGRNNIDPALVEMLDKARGFAGVPFIINSGCRCFQHNFDEGGSPTSSHVRGFAVDIATETSMDRWLILYALIRVGFNRIGIGNGFIHADVDDAKTQGVVWLYPAKE